MSEQLNVEALVDGCVFNFEERTDRRITISERNVVCLITIGTMSFMLGYFGWVDSLADRVTTDLEHAHARLKVV